MDTVLYYAPFEGRAKLEAARELEQIFQNGFEDHTYPSPERDGVLLWNFQPSEHDGPVCSDAGYVEVVLDISIDAYEDQVKYQGMTEWRRTGHYLIPAAVVNAHTISRKFIVPHDSDPLGQKEGEHERIDPQAQGGGSFTNARPGRL